MYLVILAYLDNHENVCSQISVSTYMCKINDYTILNYYSEIVLANIKILLNLNFIVSHLHSMQVIANTTYHNL